MRITIKQYVVYLKYISSTYDENTFSIPVFYILSISWNTHHGTILFLDYHLTLSENEYWIHNLSQKVLFL